MGIFHIKITITSKNTGNDENLGCCTSNKWQFYPQKNHVKLHFQDKWNPYKGSVPKVKEVNIVIIHIHLSLVFVYLNKKTTFCSSVIEFKHVLDSKSIKWTLIYIFWGWLLEKKYCWDEGWRKGLQAGRHFMLLMHVLKLISVVIFFFTKYYTK